MKEISPEDNKMPKYNFYLPSESRKHSTRMFEYGKCITQLPDLERELERLRFNLIEPATVYEASLIMQICGKLEELKQSLIKNRTNLKEQEKAYKEK